MSEKNFWEDAPIAEPAKKPEPNFWEQASIADVVAPVVPQPVAPPVETPVLNDVDRAVLRQPAPVMPALPRPIAMTSPRAKAEPSALAAAAVRGFYEPDVEQAMGQNAQIEAFISTLSSGNPITYEDASPYLDYADRIKLDLGRSIIGRSEAGEASFSKSINSPGFRTKLLELAKKKQLEAQGEILKAQAKIVANPTKSESYKQLNVDLQAAQKGDSPISDAFAAYGNNILGLPEQLAEGGWSTVKPILATVGTSILPQTRAFAPYVSAGVTGFQGYDSSLSQLIEEQGQKAGVNLRVNPEKISSLLSDPAFLADAQNEATRRGLTDAFFAYLSARVGMNDKIGAGRQSVYQAGLGGLNELAGQVAQKGTVYDPGSIIGATIGEGVFEGLGYSGGKLLQVGNPPVTPPSGTAPGATPSSTATPPPPATPPPAAPIVPGAGVVPPAAAPAAPAAPAASAPAAPSPAAAAPAPAPVAPAPAPAPPAPIAAQPAPVAAQPAPAPAPAPAKPASSFTAGLREDARKLRGQPAQPAPAAPVAQPAPAPQPTPQQAAPVPQPAPVAQAEPAPQPTPTPAAPSPQPTPAPGANRASFDPQADPRWQNLYRDQQQKIRELTAERDNVRQRRDRESRQGRSTKQSEKRLNAINTQIEEVLAQSQPRPEPVARPARQPAAPVVPADVPVAEPAAPVEPEGIVKAKAEAAAIKDQIDKLEQSGQGRTPQATKLRNRFNERKKDITSYENKNKLPLTYPPVSRVDAAARDASTSNDPVWEQTQFGNEEDISLKALAEGLDSVENHRQNQRPKSAAEKQLKRLIAMAERRFPGIVERVTSEENLARQPMPYNNDTKEGVMAEPHRLANLLLKEVNKSRFRGEANAQANAQADTQAEPAAEPVTQAEPVAQAEPIANDQPAETANPVEAEAKPDPAAEEDGPMPTDEEIEQELARIENEKAAQEQEARDAQAEEPAHVATFREAYDNLRDDLEGAAQEQATADKQVNGKKGIVTRADVLLEGAADMDPKEFAKQARELADSAESLAEDHQEKSDNIENAGREDTFDGRGSMIDGLNDLATNLREAADLADPQATTEAKPAQNVNPQQTKEAQLARIDKQLDSGIITQEQYDELKQKIEGVSTLSQLEQEVDQQLKDLFNKGRVNEAFSLVGEAAYLVVKKMAIMLAKGAKNFADVSKGLKKSFGEMDQEKLKELFEKAQGLVGRNKKETEANVKAYTSENAPRYAKGSKEISTRFPRSANPTEDAIGQKLIIDVGSLQSTEELAEKAAEAVVSYPNMRRVSGETPAQTNARFIQMVKENLLWLYNAVPENIRERSKLWYDGANKISKEWSKKYKVKQEAIAGAIAALSPQKDWFQNVALAEYVVKVFNEHQDTAFSQEMFEQADSLVDADKEPIFTPSEIKELRSLIGKPYKDLNLEEKAIFTRLHSETYTDRSYHILTPEGEKRALARNAPKKNKKGKITKEGKQSRYGWGSLREISKAISCLEDQSVANISRQMGDQHKVRNFYNNIIAPGSADGHVTIDTHAVAAGLFRPLAGKSIEVKHNFGSSGKDATMGVNGTYALYAEAYRQAAAEAGVLPREMQSITWEAVRGMYPKDFKGEKNVAAINAIWKDYKKGKISAEEARQKSYELAKKYTDANGGGISKYDWLDSNGPEGGPGGGVSQARGNAADAGELPAGGVLRGSPGSAAGRAGSKPSGGVSNNAVTPAGDVAAQRTPEENKAIQDLKDAVAAGADEKTIGEKLDALAKATLPPGRLLSFGPQHFAALAWQTARTAQAALGSFAQWSKQMIQTYGSKIKPFLKQVWADSQAIRRNAFDFATVRYLASRADKIWQNADRNPQSPTLRALANLLHTKDGTEASGELSSIPQRLREERIKFSNAFARILEPFGSKFSNMTDDQRRKWDEDFRDYVIGNKKPTDPQVAKAVAQYRQMMGELLAFQREAGIEMGDRGGNYFPRIYSPEAIEADPQGFMDAAVEMYRKRDARLGNPTKTDAEYEALASAWAFRIQNGNVDDIQLNSAAVPEQSEMPSSSKPREFSDDEAELAAKYLSKDINRITLAYIGRATKAAEIARAFGPKGEKFTSMIAKLQKEGVDMETITETAGLVRRTLGYGVERHGKFAASVIDWSNAVVAAGYLGFSFINNVLLEPVSYGVRTGNPYLGLKAVAETWAGTIRELSRSNLLNAGTKMVFNSRVEMAQSFNEAMAEQLGLLQREMEHSFLDAHWNYTEENGSPMARWIIQRTQQANLMQQTEHAKVAASAGIARLAIRDNVRFMRGQAPLQKFFKKLGMDVTAPGSSKIILNENGVPEAEHQAFADFVMGLEGKSDADYQAAIMSNERMAFLYRQAVQRMSTGMSIKSNPALKMDSSDKLEGKMMMQLMNYSYAYANLVKDAMYNKAKTAVAGSRNQVNMLDRARLAVPLLVGGTLSVIAAEAGKQLIGALWPTEGTEKRDELPLWRKLLDSASYAGMFGPKVEFLAKIMNRGQLPVGPSVEGAGKTAAAVGGMSIAGDSPQRSAKKQVYNSAVKPVVVGGSAAMHPFLGFMANQAMRQESTRDWFIGEDPKKR